RLYSNPAEAADLYTRQCSLKVSAKDLAVMGATLADGGMNPVTRQRVVSPEVCHYALAAMATAGLYETSGDWLFDIGLPGKSGIGGGIVTVSPGEGGLGTFAPPLDAAGNSVKGQLVAKFLSQRLGIDLFVSRPESCTRAHCLLLTTSGGRTTRCEHLEAACSLSYRSGADTAAHRASSSWSAIWSLP